MINLRAGASLKSKTKTFAEWSKQYGTKLKFVNNRIVALERVPKVRAAPRRVDSASSSHPKTLARSLRSVCSAIYSIHTHTYTRMMPTLLLLLLLRWQARDLERAKLIGWTLISHIERKRRRGGEGFLVTLHAILTLMCATDIMMPRQLASILNCKHIIKLNAVCFVLHWSIWCTLLLSRSTRMHINSAPGIYTRITLVF